MKLLHTSDLHIGKIINEVSMLNDQEYILKQILDIAVKEQVLGIIIAGDIYDRSIPSTDAVNLLNWFFNELTERNITIFAISGNHDSAERVGFAQQILEKQGLYIGTDATEELKRITLKDHFGQVSIVLLPFVKPGIVGEGNSQEAVRKLLQNAKLEEQSGKPPKQILVTHFFVTGCMGEQPELSDSETSTQVGGIDQVSAELFDEFDYVALGHIHKPQQISNRPIYYAGAPLAYSFSEANHSKSVNLITIEEEVSVTKIPLNPLHELRIIKGNLKDLTRSEIVQGANFQDYIKAVLTDREELMDPISSLRSVYPNIMQIQIDRKEVNEDVFKPDFYVQSRTTEELFYEFYEFVKGEQIEEVRRKIVEDILKEQK